MELLLVEIKKESIDVKSFKFGLEGIDFSFKPGQYISMKLDVNDERRGIRTFSISSPPTDKELITISTKMSGSDFKKRLEFSKIGEKIHIKGPFGRFTLQEDFSKPAVMIAGGIGITPFRSMIKYVTDKKLPLKITLLYSNKVPEEIAFKDDLDQCSNNNPNLKVLYTITRPEESKEKWDSRTGRIDENIIRKHVEDLNNSIFYVCGPPEMVDAMVKLLKDINIPDENVRVERFTGY